MKKSIQKILLSAAILSAPLGAQAQSQSINVDGYAARVNDRIITKGEILETLEPIISELKRDNQDDKFLSEMEKYYIKRRERLIEHALIMEEFESQGRQIPNHYVESEIERIIKAKFYGDRSLFEQNLTTRKTTRQEFAKEVREQIIVNLMLQEEVTRRIRITPAQLMSTYIADLEIHTIPEKVEHSVILINKGITEDEQAVKRAEVERVRQRLLADERFSDLASALSEGSRADKGGRFPWMQLKDAAPELQPTLKTLPAGEISKIIETDTAFYIVKVHARQQANIQPFKNVQSIIEKKLSEEEFDRLKAAWIAHLKNKHYVALY